MKSAAEINAQLAQKMIDFAPWDAWDTEQPVSVHVDGARIRCSQKNVVALAAKIKKAHRTFPAGAYKRVKCERVFPAFESGMTTVEYIARFAALNARAHVLPLDFEALGDRPAALYENGALDFDVIEERAFEKQADQDVAQVLADAVAAVTIGAEPEWSKKWAADMADTMAQIEAMKAEREAKSAQKMDADAVAEVACMAEACADAMADGVTCMSRSSANATQSPSHPATRAAGLLGDSIAFCNAGLNVIQAPTGRFIYAGSVPTDIGYVDGATPEHIEKGLRFGGRFGPKTRTFDTLADAVAFAESKGYAVDNKPASVAASPATHPSVSSAAGTPAMDTETMKAERESATQTQDKPTVATLVNAGIHPAVADTISRCGISAYGPLAQAEIRGKLAATEQAAAQSIDVHEAHGLPLVPHAHQEPIDMGNPTCRGKSGKWVAWLRMTWDNLHQLAFRTTPGEIAYSTYDTGGARMAALQRLARVADATQPATPDTPTATAADEPTHAKAAATTHTPPPSAADGQATPPVCAAGAPDYTHPVETLAGDYTHPVETLQQASSVDATTPSQPRHPRNIVPRGGLHIVEDAFEAWTYHHEKSDRFGFVMYLGKQSKPYAYYAYATEAKRDAGFERHAQQARDILASKAKRKAEDRAKLDAGHGLQVGDVVRSSWGYDQTNVDHYQIIKVIGKRTVEVRALAVHEESTGDMSGRVAPVWGEFVGEVMRRQVDKYGNVNMLSASYGRASKIEPVAVVHGVRCYSASHYSSYA